MAKETIMKKVLFLVVMAVLLFPVVSQATRDTTTPANAKTKIERRTERFKQEWKGLVTKVASAFNLRLASGGGIMLSQNSYIRGSKNKMKIVWVRSQNKEVVLEVNKRGTASIGYTINF
jgi:hypothetical protein